jgi:Tol biopolymer transport system component
MSRAHTAPVLVALLVSGVGGPAPALGAWPGTNGRLAFDALSEQGMQQVRTSTVDGRRERVLARFPPLPIGLERKSGAPQWSPTGNRLLYQRIATGFETVAPNGRDRRTIETPFLWPAWSPSGREIVAVVATSHPYSLVRMRLDGSRRRRIRIPPVDSVAIPRWSPSGRWILYEVGTADGVFVWRVRPDGSGARRLVRGSKHTWAPDGRRFAYTNGRDIWSVRPDGSGRRRLSRGPDNTVVASLAWSPDGRRIALVRQAPADAHDTSTVATIPARGGRERRRFGGERYIGFVDWQPRRASARRTTRAGPSRRLTIGPSSRATCREDGAGIALFEPRRSRR